MLYPIELRGRSQTLPLAQVVSPIGSKSVANWALATIDQVLRLALEAFVDPTLSRKSATTDGAPIVRKVTGRQRRKASTKPPSTGIRWPVVQRALGLARNRIACAQSSGSMA